MWGDSAYRGQGGTIRKYAPKASDFTNRNDFRNRPLSAEQCRINRTKSKVRAKVEHPFRVMKRIFGFTKVRYRGLEKNATRLFVTCALTNLYPALSGAPTIGGHHIGTGASAVRRGDPKATSTAPKSKATTHFGVRL